MKSFEFIGKPSGDGESFVWEVDVETFKQITGKELKKWDYVDTESKLVMLYPDHIFDTGIVFQRYGKLKIKIEYEEMPE